MLFFCCSHPKLTQLTSYITKDNYNADYCEYDCYNDNGMQKCIDRNPYNEGEEEEVFQLEDYMECAQLNVQNNNRRRLDQQQEEVQYFVGPYCSNEGGQIHLGLFTDEDCTIASDEGTFYTLMGFNLPYSESSIVDASCVSCLEPQDAEDNNNGNDAEDEDPVSESCEMLYTYSGKCESTLPSGMVTYPNDAACNYMKGISIVRKDGIIDTGNSRPSAVATSFIVISAMAFLAMGFYVWYLRTRLGVKKDTLL